MNNLPKPGSPDWHAWRKSGLPIERWLDERPTQEAPPAAQQTIEAPKVSGDGQPPRVDPGASSALLERFGGAVVGNVPVPGLAISPVFGEEPPPAAVPDHPHDPWDGFDADAAALPHPINPDAEPGDSTRSHPSGGLLPVNDPMLQRLANDQEIPHNHGQRKRNRERVRRDTDTEADWTNWPGELG